MNDFQKAQKLGDIASIIELFYKSKSLFNSIYQTYQSGKKSEFEDYEELRYNFLEVLAKKSHFIFRGKTDVSYAEHTFDICVEDIHSIFCVLKSAKYIKDIFPEIYSPDKIEESEQHILERISNKTKSAEIGFSQQINYLNVQFNDLRMTLEDMMKKYSKEPRIVAHLFVNQNMLRGLRSDYGRYPLGKLFDILYPEGKRVEGFITSAYVFSEASPQYDLSLGSLKLAEAYLARKNGKLPNISHKKVTELRSLLGKTRESYDKHFSKAPHETHSKEKLVLLENSVKSLLRRL